MAKTRWLIFAVAAVAAIALAVLAYEAVQQRDLSDKNRTLIQRVDVQQEQNLALIKRVDAQQEQIKKLGIETNRALCTFKNGLQRSIARTQRYLDDVQAGRRKPIPPEFTIEGVEVGLAGDVTSIKALFVLKCDDGG